MPARRPTINLRSPREMDRMRQAGKVVCEAHQAVQQRIRPGVSTRELDAVVDETFQRYGAVPLFKGVAGPVPFPAATCISVNDEVVHGIPGDRVLHEGDIVSIDTGCRVEGWCSDAAVTHAVGVVPPLAQRLLNVTREALEIAIRELAQCQWWSEIAQQMECHVVEAGFSVVRTFCGHGIGREMHESPQVPNCYTPDRSCDFAIRPGLVLAIEPMVCTGDPAVYCRGDHWTQATRDGGLAAHFEHTVAIAQSGPQVLTAGVDG